MTPVRVAPTLPDAVLAAGELLGRAAPLVAVCALVLALLALQFATVRALYGGGDASRDRRVTCPSCGARTGVETPACDYCGERIGGERRPTGDGE